MNWIIFFCVNSINILTFFLFVSRVKWPAIENNLGIATLLLSIPLLFAGTYNLIINRTLLFWGPSLIYVAWAILAFIVDFRLKIEFRNPPKAKILVPFLMLFYVSIGGMALSMWRVNFYLWLISGITTALNIYGSIYAARHGKG